MTSPIARRFFWSLGAAAALIAVAAHIHTQNSQHCDVLHMPVRSTPIYELRNWGDEPDFKATTRNRRHIESTTLRIGLEKFDVVVSQTATCANAQ